MTAVVRVLWAPTLEQAREVRAHASVEAEYGTNVVKGSLLTLAHHQRDGWFSNEFSRAPCCAKEEIGRHSADMRQSFDESGYFNILISHLDLDTIGGVARILYAVTRDDRYDIFDGVEEFWELAEAVDLNGAHRLGYDIKAANKHIERAMYAWFAWMMAHPEQRPGETKNVFREVNFAIGVISNILGERENAEFLLEAGDSFKADQVKLDTETFVSDNDGVIIRVGPNFMNHLYRDGEAVVAFNTLTGGITISLAYPEKHPNVNCRDIVQELWGDEAGGHAGIAGSPRGKRMDASCLQELSNTLYAGLRS